MSHYTVRRSALEQHIGDSDGLIAFWMDRDTATTVAHLFGYRDLAFQEIMDAVERAYPDESDDD